MRATTNIPATSPEEAFDDVLVELDERDLTPRDARVLLWLAERDSTPAELGEVLGGESTATDLAVRRLERRGLVRRQFSMDPGEPSRLNTTVAGLHALRALVERIAGTGETHRYSLWQRRAL